MPDFQLESWKVHSKVITRVMGGGEIRRNVIDAVYFVNGQRLGCNNKITELPMNATRKQVEAELKQHLGIAD